ncbi:MAG: type I-C CRISPR-associated protein Cas8c/Csd1 [Minicystis sp.]
MILQSLVALARREELLGDPGYDAKPVHWIILIDAKGGVLSVRYTGAKNPGDKRETVLSLPIPKRRSRGGLAVVPDILVDKALYVLGLGDPDKPDERERLAECLDTMIEETGVIAKTTGDEGARAQWKAMQAIRDDPASFARIWAGNEETILVPQGKDRAVAVPKRWKTNRSTLFAFELSTDDPVRLVCRRPAVRRWIAEQAAPEEAEGSDDGDLCLVSGTWCVPVATHDQIDLPGDTGRLPLISFNQPAFEHYGRTGNQNAPVSKEAANAYFIALRRLLARGDFVHPTDGCVLPRRNLSLTSSTTVLYWCDAADRESDPTDDLLLDALARGDAAEKAKHIEAVYSAPRTGRPVLREDPTLFYTLVLTREKSRVVLRSADLHTVGDVAQSVEQFLKDVDICPRFVSEREHRGLVYLVEGTRSANASGAEPIADLSTRLYRCALDRRLPYPREVLSVILGRVRCNDKEGPSTRRMALLKAVLNRTFSTDLSSSKELSVSLNPDYPSTAYQLGRLFAVLEKVQQDATNAKAGIADRFLGTAMAAPALVFPRLLKLKEHHLSKIGGEHPGWEVNLRKLIDAIAQRLPPELPMTQALVQQGTFMIGYHHQRAALWPERPAAEPPPPAPTGNAA